MGLRITRKASIFNSKLIFTAMAVFALAVQPVYAVVVSYVANATIVTNANPGEWRWGGAASPSGVPGSAIITANTATGGNAALQLSTPAKASYIWGIRDTGVSDLLSDISEITYKSQRVEGSDSAAPALLLLIDRDGDTTDASDTFYAFYEPYYNNNPATTDYDLWNTWTINPATSKFWSTSVVGDLGGKNGANMFTLDYVESKHMNATITAYRLNQGTGNTAWKTWVDQIAVNGVMMADFELEEVVTNTTTGEVYEDLQSAINTASDSDELRLNRDITLLDDVDVTKSVTIDGNNKTISANFSKTGNDNNSLLSVLADNVIIKNVTLDGVDSKNQLHGINAYQVTNLKVENVVAKHFRTGILYNGSTGTIQDVHTMNNIWHGINVDKAGANVNVLGVNTHTEDFNIYVDDETTGAIVNAPAYKWERSGIAGRDNDRVYRLKAIIPTEPVTPVTPVDPVQGDDNDGEEPQTSSNTPDTSTPVVAVTTPVTTTPNEETEEVDQAISSTDDETDVAGEQDAEEKWSLVNALLAAATVILSVIAVAGIRQSEEDSKLIRLLTILPAVGAVGAVLWIEDFTAAGPGWVSPWTLLFAAIIALQVALFRSVDAAEE